MSPRHGHSEQRDDDEGTISHLDEKSFDALEDQVDRIGSAQPGDGAGGPGMAPDLARHAPLRTDDDFRQAVRVAISALPPEFQRALDGVVVRVSDDGAEQHAYGMFVRSGGRTVSPDQIFIYRDTLLRDFGHDPALLRAKVTETVRHEVGHALGLDESQVRGLGL
jgi:predicted Zn-dependent protease with MMP-like domain